MLVWARDVTYTIAAPVPATIYYTLDGSEPVPGAPNTMGGPGPVQVKAAGVATIKWRADAGPETLLEAVRSIVHKTEI